MRKEWEKLYESLADFQEDLEELLADLPQSKHFKQESSILKRKWAISQRLANDLDQLIGPVETLSVHVPFFENDFVDAWKFWKEYLNEQHSISMKSRMEIQSLKRLMEISDKKMDQAILILEFAESCGYKNFFKVDDKMKDKPLPENTNTINY